jgi:FlaA1/EpsC-like NDP-sugar epimerase
MPYRYTKKIILNLPRPAKRALVIVADLFICLFSVWLAFVLRLDQWGPLQGRDWWVLLAAVGFSLPLFISFGLYRAIFRYVGAAALTSIVLAFALYTAFFSLIFTVIGINEIPRSIGILQPLLFFIGIGGSRYFARIWLNSGVAKGSTHRHQKPVALIYGAGSAGRQLAAAFSINKEVDISGFIDDDRSLQGNTINGIHVYSEDDLLKLINSKSISDVLLALPSATQNRRNEIIANLSGCGVHVRTLPGLIDIAAGRVKMSDLQELDMNDLLGRKVVPPNIPLLEQNIREKVVLVTGAGGSIGSELCRQIIKFSPKSLVLIESSEHSLYLIYEELKRAIKGLEKEQFEALESDNELEDLAEKKLPITLVPYLASVRDKELISNLFASHKPDTVFHAAAYKHVPLVEQNPSEGIRNNVLGTLNCAQAALECNVSHFVLVSTDKAVRPTNVMGASKRIAELILQAIAEIAIKEGIATKFCMVRFGNVLGSSGSVAPLFTAQIKAGGPITLTHAEVTRYFMTIPEAAQLVIQASSMATGGDVFVLDMGQPVRIYDLAEKMVYLHGLSVKTDLNPKGDIEILVTGLRPGEKLYEELLIGDDPQATDHPKIMKAHEVYLSWDELEHQLIALNHALQSGDMDVIRGALKQLVPGYHQAIH